MYSYVSKKKQITNFLAFNSSKCKMKHSFFKKKTNKNNMPVHKVALLLLLSFN